jgi:hypothetical protein
VRPAARVGAAGLVLVAGLVACADRSSRMPAGPGATAPYTVSADAVREALLVTPATALSGASAYGVVVTSRIRDPAGRGLRAAPAFAALHAAAPVDGDGPVALYDADPDAAGNPYPDARLVREDRTIRVPDRHVLRGLPDVPEAATARRLLRAGRDMLETLHGFSTTAPIRIALSAPVDLATVDGTTLLLVERADGALDLAGLVEASEALGVASNEIVLAFSFPTQPIEDDLVAVQGLLRERAAGLDVPASFEDPDPADDLPIGVFASSDPEFAGFLAGAPEVRAVAAGLVASPDFRGPAGTWLPERVRGDEPAPEATLDFLLTVPAGSEPPYPVVLLQHGFGGSNDIVLELGPALARAGLATIGIDAVLHGRRGSPLDLLRASPFRARDVFRQTIADQMTLLRAIERGIDLDGDGRPDLDAARTSYLGISLGGLIGATLVAVEEILPTAVLNVAGGRVAFLGQSPGVRDLVTASLAEEAELDPGDPLFQVYLQRLLETGQHAMDTVDGLNFARRWFLDPFPGVRPHRVLLQEGIGDLLVDNASTEALAAAGGLVANTPVSDPDGVSGLWRFEPPGGHGILARGDVQAQAFRFLASDGTEIVDPASGPAPR